MENAIIGAVGVLLGVTITGAISIGTKWLEVRSGRKRENRRLRIERLEELHGLLWKMANAKAKYARLASAKDGTMTEQRIFPGNIESSARAQTLIQIYLDEALDDSIRLAEAELELQVLENRRENGEAVIAEVHSATQRYLDAHGKTTWKLNQRLKTELND